MVSEVEKIAKVLTAAQRRALLAMTREWQFSGTTTFNWPGAWSLLRERFQGRQLCEMSGQQNERRSFRDAFRLTPLGEQVRSYLKGSCDE